MPAAPQLDNISWPQGEHSQWKLATDVDGIPRNLAYLDNLKLDPKLQPKSYDLAGTHSESKILFLDVNILDSTGRLPYRGDVLIKGERIVEVGTVANKAEYEKDPTVRKFHGRGRTLMSGLGDAHTHFSWNGGDLGRLGDLDVEEHVLLTIKSAQCFLDSGYTMCFGAAAAKDRLDVVTRDAINAGDIPGPRYLANAREIAKPDGDLVAGITRFAAGPEGVYLPKALTPDAKRVLVLSLGKMTDWLVEMREVVRYNIEKLGVDNVKLSMSGEEITDIRSAQDCYFTDEDTAACVEVAHSLGKRLCAHARARDSVTMCVRHNVDVVYHGSYVDDEGMDLLEKAKHKTFVAPAINWLWATTYEAEAFGYTQAAAENAGYLRELHVAVAGLREMHRRGIVVLPGGDYGFAWTPHGTYARDLEHFVTLLGFTPHESIIAATTGVAALLMRSHELGKIQPGYYADCILVDGDPLKDITVLQDHDKLNVIMINGRVHKAGRKEYLPDSSVGVPSSFSYSADFPEVKRSMQKSY